MIRPLNRDTAFLAQKAEPATPADLAIGQDLQDTLQACRATCVGMAANMIGFNKRIIIFVDDDGAPKVLYNPVILKKEGSYKTEEGCLSLLGTRPTVRYKKIKVQYQTEAFQTRVKTWSGYTAQIIQHEVDHCEGILI